MRRRRAMRSASLAGACAVIGALMPGRAEAQWVVIDPSNLEQNIIQVAHAVEQINNQWLQIENQLRALRKLDTPNWRAIEPVLRELDLRMQRGKSLGYSLANLDQQFQETFPGWEVAADNLALPEAQRTQAQRTLGTMGAALSVLNEQVRQLQEGQATLGSIKTQVQGINGTQEALELQATLDVFMAEEIGLLRQTISTQANLQAVYNAYRINLEAEMRANYRAMMDRMSTLPPPSRRTFSLMMEP